MNRNFHPLPLTNTPSTMTSNNFFVRNDPNLFFANTMQMSANYQSNYIYSSQNPKYFNQMNSIAMINNNYCCFNYINKNCGVQNYSTINIGLSNLNYKNIPMRGFRSTENWLKFKQDENIISFPSSFELFEGNNRAAVNHRLNISNQKVNNIYNNITIDSFINSNSSLGFDVDKSAIEEFTQRLNQISEPLEKFLCTKRGPKVVSKLIEKYPNDCITVLINTLQKNIIPVMKDCSGNYFCQNLINSSSSDQLNLILSYINEEFVSIANDFQGTHVLQALVDQIKDEKCEAIILNCIKNKELGMALDTNASHVLKKILIKINEIKRININEVILKNFIELSSNASGVCCLKDFINYNITPFIRDKILKLTENNLIKIANDCYGNYIIQTVLEKWGLFICNTIVNKLIRNICILSMKKISSNVSKKLIDIIDKCNLQYIIKELFYGKSFAFIVKNKYGRYVLQNCIDRMNLDQRKQIYEFLDKNDYFIKNQPSNKDAIMNSLFKNNR